MINLNREETFNAVKEGVKEALLTMTESGDGYSGPIILEPFLDAIRQGIADGFSEMLGWGKVPFRDRVLESIEKGTYQSLNEMEKNE